MLRYLCLGLLLGSLAVAANPEITHTRWQGRWGDGLRDALRLSPGENGQMQVHYWRKLNAQWQQPELQFDAIAQVRQTEPLSLFWTIEGDPDGGSMALTYQPEDDSMRLTYQSPNQQGSVTLTRADAEVAQPPAEPCLTPRPGTQAVTFVWHAPQAQAVYLAGEMNDWQADSLPMTRQADGDWRLTVHLGPGRWAYKLVQDGRWLTDAANPQRQADGQGGYNSLIQLGEPDANYLPRSNPAQRGRLQEVSLESSELGPRQVLIYRPAGVTASTPLPWALALHGYGMDRHQWVDDGQLPALLDNLIAEGKMPPMALVMVDGGKSFYQGPIERFLIRELLPQAPRWGLSEQPAQRALLGVSMGGYGVVHLAYQYPQLFAAGAALSGYFAYGPQEQWTAAGLQAMPPVRLYCGQQDHTSLTSNQQLEQQLRQAGLTPAIQYAEGGHTWHYWQSILPELMPELARAITPRT
ncbi:alpha/beta hydrolase [Pseudaeromonas paramecii]|uniref:AMP-activated protein kinase glycogen-binding domain-containing protein n=1 Tax=Pseudaeromonas paramecii TaxID=2138166 RepID=A0ABP8QL36_9GAMM